MKETELICIGCPMGCPLHVVTDGAEVISVTGNTCPRGDAYARKEVTNPTRIVTSSVRVYGSREGAVTVSCKTKSDVPKASIFDVVMSLKGVSVKAPINIGDVIMPDAAGTGVDVVATKCVR